MDGWIRGRLPLWAIARSATADRMVRWTPFKSFAIRCLASRSLEMDSCSTVKITLYKKAGCPWSAAIIGFLNELNIPYEIKM